MSDLEIAFGMVLAILSAALLIILGMVSQRTTMNEGIKRGAVFEIDQKVYRCNVVYEKD